eukprot:5704929-Amphidinium_carterae.1
MDDDDTVYVQNKIGVSDPPSSVAGSTVPEQGVKDQQVQYVPATPKAALKGEVSVTDPEAGSKLPTAMLNSHTVCLIEPGVPPPPVPIQ